MQGNATDTKRKWKCEAEKYCWLFDYLAIWYPSFGFPFQYYQNEHCDSEGTVEQWEAIIKGCLHQSTISTGTN